MNKNKIIKPCNCITRLFLLKSLRYIICIVFLFSFLSIRSQNTLQKQLSATSIKTIAINGNQIFNISVSTSKTDKITVTSMLDGEYQNDFQVVIEEENHVLNLGLEHLSLFEIPDDKRNAHKVIAATLRLEIPEQLILTILSDIGSVDLKGDFKSLYVELLQGQCHVVGEAETATINTLDGDINVETKHAKIEASSNHGSVVLDQFKSVRTYWKLTSINGNIKVAKQE